MAREPWASKVPSEGILSGLGLVFYFSQVILKQPRSP